MQKVARMLITFALLCFMAAAMLELLTACASRPDEPDWAKISAAVGHRISPK